MIHKLVSMSKIEIENEMESAQKIVNDYGAVMEANANPVNDINTLCATKEDIKNAIKVLIVLSYLYKDLSNVDLLKYAYIQLGSFQVINRKDLTKLDTMNNLSSSTNSVEVLRDPKKCSDNEKQKMKEVLQKFHDANSVFLPYIEKSNEERVSLRLEIDEFVKSQLLELNYFVESLKLKVSNESKTKITDIKSDSIQTDTETKSKEKPLNKILYT
ncbi:MAG: hypothetical protein AB2L12_10875 [Smithellaceae bacterium]